MIRRCLLRSSPVSLVKFRPLGDRVLVQKDAPNRETASGLLLPKEEKVVEAEVVAVGPGTKDSGPLSVKVGDRVVTPDWGGQKLKIGGDNLFLFRESEILGVVDK